MKNISKRTDCNLWRWVFHWDFIYVDDLCRGIIQALHNNNKGCDVFHLGTGIETSIIGLINTIIRTWRKEGISIKYLDKRKGEAL